MIIYGIHPFWWENMSEKAKNDVDKDPSEKGRSSRFRKRSNISEPREKTKDVKGSRSSRRRRSKRPRQDIEVDEYEKSQSMLWLEQNWKIIGALVLIFFFGLFLRSYFYYSPATENGFILSGNDPYYHKRVVDYVQDNHNHLIFDPLLSYPDGSYNPRPPLFDWSIAIIGLLLSPLFGGNTSVSTWQVMEFSPAFWGALTAIPAFFIGKEMFNKKVGIICAFLLATMPSHVERSPLGFSDHDAIVLFFVVLSFFFFIKALNQLNVRDRWVENWKNPKDIPKGFKEWFKYNQVSVAFALLTGISLATVALIWKGFLYPVVIIIVYFFIQLILNKLRNKDSLGVALCTIIPLAIVAFLPMPYYFGNHLTGTITPASEMLLAVIVVSAILVPTRDSPWLLVFTTLAVVLIAGLLMLMYVFPDIGSTYFSGQGYFGENKIFSTIAEAQAPDYSRAMFSYGVVTTFLALFGIFLSIVRVAKDLKAHYLFMTIWGITAVYMAISATRFIFNAGPIFAILSGWIIYELVVKLDFKQMFKHYRSLKGGGRFYGLKKSVKVRHVAGVLFLVFMIIIPNVWLGWDAGVPFGEKKEVDVAVYDAFPFFMKPAEQSPDGEGIMYNRSNLNDLKYFGAFGHGFPSDYWLDSMKWLSEQDTELPIEDRPAFISWWDYGFWAIQLGEHPTAADNFQGRVQYAGSFISARNESQSISLLIARILEADKTDYVIKDGHSEFKLHDSVRAICQKYFGVEKTAEIEDVLINTPDYVSEVLDNPDKYGYYSADMVPAITPIYAILQNWIPELLTDDERVWLLHELYEETGYSLRYFAIDSRLFPFGPQNTGIYYAPLKLSDHRISDNNEPYDFLQTLIKGSDNREYTLEEFRKAQERDPDLQVQDFNLKYYDLFLESMLLKCYIGYTLEDIGATDSSQNNVEPNLPGVHAQNFPPMPAWMMKHYQLVYRTSYRNPFNTTEYLNHPDAWEAMLDTEANELVNRLENDGIDNDRNGIVDDRGEGGVVTSGLRSGVVYIKYYEGAYLNGTVKTDKGQPVPGIRVSVSDEYGIPHDAVLTDENGTYHLIAPEGNVSVHASTGGFGEGELASFNILSQQEEISLNRTNIEISDDQVMRRKIDEDGDGVWDYNINYDFVFDGNSVEGNVFWDVDTNDEYNEATDLNITDVNVIAFNTDRDLEYNSSVGSDGTYLFEDLTPGAYDVTVDMAGHKVLVEFVEPLNLGKAIDEVKDIGIKAAKYYVNVSAADETILDSKEIRLYDHTNDTSIISLTDSHGNASFDMLLAGNYTLFVELDGFGDYQNEIEIVQGNLSGEEVLLWPSTDVDGRMTRSSDGLAISNVTIRFEGIEKSEGTTRFVQTESDGSYSFAIGNGKYIVSVKHDLGDEAPLVFYDIIEFAGGDINYDISLLQSVEVYGVVYRDFDNNGTIEQMERRPYAEVTFESTTWKTHVSTNFSGFYRVFLPLDDYNVYATYRQTRGSYIGEISITGSNKIEYNIKVINGKTLQGVVYFDVNENDIYEVWEGLSYSNLTFTDANGAVYKTQADAIGLYNVELPVAIDYTVLVESEGFITPSPIGPMNLTELQNNNNEFQLNPVEIILSGVTQYEGSTVENVSINFTVVPGNLGENKTVQSDSNGDFTVNILPGEYFVDVDFNTSSSGKQSRYRFNDTLFIDVGEGTKDYDIELIKLVPINGTINGTTVNVTITFELVNGEGNETQDTVAVNGTFDLFLLPGDYIVSVDEVVNSSHFVYLNTHDFTQSETVALNLSVGVKIEGVARYGGSAVAQDIEINFINNSIWKSVTSGGSFNIFLAPNQTYEIMVNFTTDDGGKQVRYTYSDSITINDTTVSGLIFNLTKFVQVTGQVYLDWDEDTVIDSEEVMDNITVKFENTPDIFQAQTNATGYYEVYLEVDVEYDVTFASDFPIKDEGITKKPSLPGITKYDFSIIPENLTVTGRTQNESNDPLGSTVLWFWARSQTALNSTSSSDASGNYSLTLSYGEYDLYARKVTGSQVFVHLGQLTVRPRKNQEMAITLVPALRVKGKAYYLNSTGQNLSAKVRIDFNDGSNIFSDSNSNGQFEMWLPEGTYETSSDLETNEYGMSMNYTYEKSLEITQDTTIYLNLSKIDIHEVELEWIEDEADEIQQNGSTTYSINIKNVGNIKDTYDLLKSSDPDWNISLIENITLEIGKSSTIDVFIQSSEDAKVDHQAIEITAASRGSPTTSDKVELKVNITQVYKAANVSVSDKVVAAEKNTLRYYLIVQNMGNGKDNFSFNVSEIPEGWNITLNPDSADLLGAQETQEVEMFITISYDSLIDEGVVKFITTSEADNSLISEFDAAISLSNLEARDSGLSVTGDDVTEGPVDREPIPGFEAFALIAALFGVAVIMKRRRIQ
jgi:dolichyl-diphosphooligosaccharide--protein glycosyltransferase